MKSHKKVIDKENIEELKNLLAQKNRELEIEAALERVRTMTMAMHKTEGLIEVIKTVFMQFELLEVRADVCFINIHQADSNDWNLWVSTGAGQTYQFPAFPYIENPVFRLQLQARERGDTFYTSLTDKKSKDQFFDHFFKHLTGLDVPKARLEYIYNAKGIASSFTISRHATIALANYSCIPYTEEENQILQRIGNVFEQTYTRFLDLQKAEAQTLEAQIEAALERVRSRTMAMHKSQELSDVATVLFQQMSTLKLEPVSCALGIFNEKSNSSDVYFSIDGKIFPESLPIPNNINQNLSNTFNAWKKGEKLQFHDLQGEEARYHDKSIINYLNSKGITLPAEAEMVEQPRRVDYHAFFSHGLLLFSYTAPIDKTGVLVRFAKVFEQAYLRFLDIQKAEAQAREAQIEVALERVRSRTMAMQHSDELIEVVSSIFNALKQLDYNPHDCTIFTFDFNEEVMNCWSSIPAEKGLSTFQYVIPIIDHPFIDQIISSFKKKQNILNYHLAGDEKKSYDDLFFQSVNFPEMEVALRAIKALNSSFIFMSKGALATFTETSISEKDIKLLERFSKVVDLSYSRFLDLKKAEAQAREAQIEAALERIRSASMAMHKSEELPQVALTFLTQIEELAIPVLGVGLAEINKETNTCVVYFADNTEEGQNRELSISKEFEINEFWLAEEGVKRMKSGKKEFTVTAEGERLELWIEWIDKIFSKKRAERLRSANLDKVYFHTNQFHDYSNIIFSSLEPLSEEYRPVIQRLVSTFKLSYLRFLDLQKAEAQSRESEIQLALERVRARTMAMQNSTELAETASVLFEQLRKLDSNLWSCGFVLCEKDNPIDVQWMSVAGGGLLPPQYVPHEDQVTHHNMYKAWEDGNELYSEVLEGERLQEVGEFLMTIPSVRKNLEQLTKAGFEFPAYQKMHAARFSNGYLLIITFDDFKDTGIFIRFAKVFDQTYTRFLDLQKAEAQAREAEIQLALERVRAQTMAMHSSKDMGDCILKMFGELTSLGVDEGTRFGIGILNHDNENNQLWTARKEGEEVKMHIGNLDMTSHPLLKSARKAWKEQVSLHRYVLEGDDLLKYYEMINTAPGYKLRVSIEKLPEREFHYGFIFDHGFFYAFSLSEFQQDLIHIAQRFSAVFEQTYRRFLDLQKAEAQAREAEIQLALERVRARTMAMHTSGELADAASVLFQQVLALDLKPVASAFVIVDEKAKTGEVFISADGTVIPDSFIVPYHGESAQDQIFEAWKKKESYTIIDLKGEKLEAHLKFIARYMPVGEMLEASGETQPDRLSLHILIFKYGFLGINFLEPNDEAIPLLQRFAKVFEQTYTRFLDLQKAEGQAREAEIQLALERVRAKAMAMHSSSELAETAAVLFEQMKKLGISPERTNISLFKEESRELEVWSTDQKGSKINHHFTASLDEPTTGQQAFLAWKKGLKSISIELSGKKLTQWIEYVREVMGMTLEEELVQNKRTHNLAFFSQGMLITTTVEPLPQESMVLMERFASVFNLTYQRFLDLQKAEARAREAKVETALERIRSSAMAMHSSDGLSEVAAVLREQMALIGQKELESCIVQLYEKGSDHYTAHYSFKMPNDPDEELIHDVAKEVPWKETEWSRQVIERYNSGADNFIIHADHSMLKEWYAMLARVSPRTVVYDKNGDLIIPDGLYYYFSCFSGGFLSVISYKMPGDETQVLLNRAANTFDMAFRRYLDLKMAEAQAREAKIEVALERVRSKALAMQNSGDLLEVTVVLRDQMGDLGQKELESSIIQLYNSPDTFEGWYTFQSTETKSSKFVTAVAIVPVKCCAFIEETLRKYQSDETEYTIVSEGKKLVDWYHVLEEVAPETIEYDAKGKMIVPKILYYHHSNFYGGSLLMVSVEEPSEEVKEMQRRAAKVFNFAYQRFLDLKRAEEQTREAQIEVALERIRAKALAMQSSADLHDVSIVLREQMGMLGQPDLESSIVHLYNNSESLESWYTFRSTETNSEKIVTDVAIIPVDSCEYIKETIEKYNSNESEYTIVSKGKKLADWYYVMEKVAPDTIEYDKNGKILIPKILYYHHSKFSGGALLLISNQPPVEESKELQRRAARVFDFAYQRFLDLKKAEEQAHEAKIEASLERVRAQTMAMQHSDDLIQCTTVIFEEFEKLNLSVQRCGIGVVNSRTKDCRLWSTVVTEGGTREIATGVLSLSVHPMLKGIFEAWENHESFLYVLEGKELQDYYRIVSRSGFHLPDEVIRKAPTLPKQFCYFSLFGAGGLYVFSEKEPTDKEKQIVRRFSEVFNLTYTRYEDLQKAEERAKEATKQASLDRVRGEIASMRSKDDLERITPLIWHELTVLGVPFIRCGVFIMDNENSVLQSYLSTPDGKSLGVYDLPYGSTEIAKKLLQRWKIKKTYKEHWDKDQFLNFMNTMAKRGLIQNQQVYQGDAKPPESLDLHFVPFKQGMLYVGNISELKEEVVQLVQSLADSFSIAYARYEDFRQLEEAKNQIEKTFTELKSTQTQLIQSEKMASLGELTAGIAHEIQNPLNFVNNFSEVSKELIEEMNDEIEAGNLEDVKEISEDIKQNLDKINHHGQRASSIVKGMLEHSRTSKKEKELTDLNLLADEYLRLSYHGLRAKDKSFNADFKLELDEDLPKVNVIGQEIGRVLLNLINNAFYAVSKRARKQLIDSEEKVKDSEKPDYIPTVIVKTKKIDKFIEIRVRDNGDGIPPHVIDKIFQPFFTTKPTGQGTGLGLSLSYDIITKGHNGSLEVDSVEGLGTEFIIRL